MKWVFRAIPPPPTIPFAAARTRTQSLKVIYRACNKKTRTPLKRGARALPTGEIPLHQGGKKGNKTREYSVNAIKRGKNADPGAGPVRATPLLPLPVYSPECGRCPSLFPRAVFVVAVDSQRRPCAEYSCRHGAVAPVLSRARLTPPPLFIGNRVCFSPVCTPTHRDATAVCQVQPRASQAARG